MNLKKTKIFEKRLNFKDFESIVDKNADFFVCGPKGFLNSVLDFLREMKIPKSQINYEYFGPQLQQ